MVDVINPAWIALGVTFIINFVTVGFISGTLSSRVAHMEDELHRVTVDIKEMRALIPELAALKAQLEHINASLTEMKAVWVYISRKEHGTNA